ncbi:MAG: DUF1343 domain-containing protein [Bacteroidota bacterium]
MKPILLSFLVLTLSLACNKQEKEVQETSILPGAWQTGEYLPLLEGKNVAMVVNHTSTIKNTHLVDSLVSLGINIKMIFSPEHGFRGDADAGKKIDSSIDEATGIQIISLYGKQRKPTPENLEGIDLVIFDIQDVGARFYTYISTMHYAMEACAENNIPMLILDRPNPTGDYIAGPVRKPDQKTFVGMHPIPIVHGLTVGELAQMINGEKWLDTLQCELKIIKNKNYAHFDKYEIPIKPSPNLPTARSIRLYPSLCLFEGTIISIGRGTEFPFQVAGYPDSTFGSYSFTPVSIPGAATYPKHENKLCYGIDLRDGIEADKFTLKYVMDFFKLTGSDTTFFSRPAGFDRLAGTSELRKQMLDGMTLEEIEASWEEDLEQYKAMRKKYLLYPDFE